MVIAYWLNLIARIALSTITSLLKIINSIKSSINVCLLLDIKKNLNTKKLFAIVVVIPPPKYSVGLRIDIFVRNAHKKYTGLHLSKAKRKWRKNRQCISSKQLIEQTVFLFANSTEKDTNTIVFDVKSMCVMVVPRCQNIITIRII